jgi:hypothetical protein
MAASASHIVAMVQVEVAPRDDMARRPVTHVFPSHQYGDWMRPIGRAWHGLDSIFGRIFYGKPVVTFS